MLGAHLEDVSLGGQRELGARNDEDDVRQEPDVAAAHQVLRGGDGVASALVGSHQLPRPRPRELTTPLGLRLAPISYWMLPTLRLGPASSEVPLSTMAWQP